MPRIISGTAGGIKITTLEGRNTRPTTDRAKEALFSMLGDIFWDIDVLDLFAGSGSLGLEALSRGAASTVFVDQNARCASIIKKNAIKCSLWDKSRIIKAYAGKAIRILSEEGNRFGCIFMDPPYDKGLVSLSIEKIVSGDIIGNEGILVVEHSDKEKPDAERFGFAELKSRNYGTVNFSIYRYKKG